MGKHNGKARKTGLKVGQALTNHAKHKKAESSSQAHKHTTDIHGPGMQSVVEGNDLYELMSMAELAGRDFTAEKQQVVVISTGAREALQQHSSAERLGLEDKYSDRLSIPRRPPWNRDTTPEELDTQERAAFVAWRRALAAVEEEGGLLLTPFEKNLEVWRQLWRVLERSHIVAQVVDARDPLFYWSEDLAAYALELNPTKRSIMVLNKADLLPADVRQKWSEYLTERGIDHVFWSAKTAIDALCGDGAAPSETAEETGVSAVLGVDGLLRHIEQATLAAAAESAPPSVGDASTPSSSEHAGQAQRVVAGLTGYPNVGKSSTINALFGSKKTAVAPTPGKTKHFQTLNITDTLCLCDCPGLVLPRYAPSKAEMVAAGVIPIDRLTDVRGPVQEIANRLSRSQIETVYNVRLPAPGVHEPALRPPTAAELLRAVASARGWVAASGLPDETRAGRQILKDYVGGKLRFWRLPPVCSDEGVSVDLVAQPVKEGESVQGLLDALAAEEEEQDVVQDLERLQAQDATGPSAVDADVVAAPDMDVNEADLDLLESLDLLDSTGKSKRPDYKFHKKATRSKGNRGQAKDSVGTLYDGAAVPYGKRGGLVHISSAVV